MLAAVHHKMVGQKINELLAITWSKKMLELIFLQPKGNITYNYHYNDFSDYNACFWQNFSLVELKGYPPLM